MTPRSDNPPLTVVIVDDNVRHLELLEASVCAATDRLGPVCVQTYESAEQALVYLPADVPVAILCDYRLSGSTGLEWLADFIRADVGPVIMITSSGDQQVAADAFRQGAFDYIEKATAFSDPARVGASIGEALRRFTLERSNRELSRRLKVANRELQRKNATLADLTATAHRFVDDVAHEFRTPLTVIKEFASILRDGIGGEVTPQQAEYIDFISGATRDLAHLIDDFLDSGKLRAQTLRVDRRPHAPGDLVDSAWPMLEARAREKQVTLETRITPGLPHVFADADKFRRTLVNLVVNAIKFSNPGGIVTVSAVAGERCVELGVHDHGPGLPQREAQKLFERFEQGGGAARSGTKGFGLGLSIVRELVALNLGRVSVTSAVGEGSTFSFTLPAADETSIVHALCDRAEERSQFTMLSGLRVTQPVVTSDDELRTIIAGLCHATDVQLPSSDGRSVIVVGETIEPERWRSRIDLLDRELRPDAPESTRLVIDQVGTWPVSTARATLLERTAEALEPTCG